MNQLQKFKEELKNAPMINIARFLSNNLVNGDNVSLLDAACEELKTRCKSKDEAILGLMEYHKAQFIANPSGENYCYFNAMLLTYQYSKSQRIQK